MRYAETVTMCYEGDKSKPHELVCVFSWRGEEWRLKYDQIVLLASIYDQPKAVREYILRWAEFLHNPD